MLTGYYPQQQQQHHQQMLLNGQQNGSGKDVPSSKNRPLTSSVYKTPTTANVIISASSSRMFTSTSYEISDEISRANVQVLERKYGGRVRAHTAATKIQRAFRRFQLEQQFQNALKYPGPPGRRKLVQPMFALPNDSSLNSFQLNVDRQLYTRKLALSQPTLKYQPVVSLRAQLRAEQSSFEDQFSNLPSPVSGDSPFHSRSPPSPRPTEPMPTKIRKDMFNSPRSVNASLMSPRLTQRRHPAASSIREPCRITVVHPPVFQSQKYLDLPPSSGEKYRTLVAGGTSPSVWVQRTNEETPASQTDSIQKSRSKGDKIHDNRMVIGEPRKENTRPRTSENGHPNAYYTNSLPRMDRRNHSLGPHTSSNNSSGFLSLDSLPNLSMMVPGEESARKRFYRIALNNFNRKPDRGLSLLISCGFVENDPKAVADFFLVRRGLSKLMVGEFLGTLRSPFHSQVLECYLNNISMSDMDVDVALRQMLCYFRFPSEAQKIDHIIQAFAKRYLESNPRRYPGIDEDTIYVVAFAIIMLNTDLHTRSIKDSKRMKCEDFITNLRRVQGTEVFTNNMLAAIYQRIKCQEFQTSPDHVTQVMRVDDSIFGKGKPLLAEPHRRLICYCRINQVLDLNSKQKPTDHNRELFLFNDLLVVAKTAKKKVAQYQLRYWTPLLGLKFTAFQTQFHRNGFHIYCPDGEEFIFNAKNEDDRTRFLNDMKETILEATEMESLRIELELDKQASSSQRDMVGSRLARNHASAPKVWTSAKKIEDFADNEVDHNSPIINTGRPIFPLSDSVTPTPSVSVGKLSHNGVSTSSGCSASNASTASASSNSTPAPPNRRLSFNSLDSGMVEEAVDLSV